MSREKPLLFRQMLNLSGTSQQPKNEKNGIIPSNKTKCPKSGIFIITGWGELGKAILHFAG